MAVAANATGTVNRVESIAAQAARGDKEIAIQRQEAASVADRDLDRAAVTVASNATYSARTVSLDEAARAKVQGS